MIRPRRIKPLQALALLPIAMILTGGANASTTYYAAVSSTSYANVREHPSMESLEISALERGEQVEATGAMEGLWVEVQTDSITIRTNADGTVERSEPLKGWVRLSLLSLEAPYDNLRGRIAGEGRVRLREEPAGARLAWMDPGDEVEVLAVVDYEAERWYRVRHASGRGWVMAEYVETTNP